MGACEAGGQLSELGFGEKETHGHKEMAWMAASSPKIVSMDVGAKNVVVRARDSLAGDLQRLVKRAAQRAQWDPTLVYIPPVDVADPEELPVDYVSPGTAPCRMGLFCQGHVIGMGTLPILVTPRGKSFADLCLHCLRLAVTRNAARGHPHTVLKNLKPFRLTEF